ncbi:hypothetical protein H0H81_002039, partial [Sphagnurus paluster]
NLDIWRQPGSSWEDEEKIWKDLDEVFREAGFTLWPHQFCAVVKTPDLTYPISNGFGYASPGRTDLNRIGNVGMLRRFDYTNPLSRAIRTPDGHDVIVRIIVMGNEGHEHLKILRKLGTGETSLFSNNHTLPMFGEFQFEDITFGIFPKVGGAMRDAWYYWAKNSVGDVVDMIMQMLEALAFIHSMNVTHRDAFHDNFLVQWQPESLREKRISVSRPRVYLIDFEVAIQFPPECPPHERVSVGFPLGGSFPDLAYYGRPHAPECVSGNPYDPFKLDVWQFGKSFWNFKVLDLSKSMGAIDSVFTF